MATNPIQRRSRQSFLLGFLIALVVMAVVVVILFTKINSLNEDLEKTKKQIPKESTIYVLNDDVKSGDEITSDMFDPVTIKTDTSFEGYYITPYDFDDEATYISKGEIAYGSMVVYDMIVKSEDIKRNDERFIEYNMIVLPTQLKNGDYIDIRLMMPNGKDYIVLAKKHVEQSTAKSIWLDMNEEELLTMNSVIVDAYITPGTKLYATIYTDPGMQEPATITYPVSDDILEIMNSNPNIVDEARKELRERWNADIDQNGSGDLRDNRTDINGYTSEMTTTEKTEKVTDKVNEEVGKISENRDEFVSELEGTGLVGIDAY